MPQPSLVGAPAPDFELVDTDARKVALHDLRRDGPVLVVFYYGYFCSHCVAQLFGLEQDLSKFERSGVHIVALSPDPPNETAAKFQQYGRFHFPVLSDPENRVAERYGVYTRATQNREEDRKHATFLVDQNGKVRWAYTGYRPFVDTDLLLRLARGACKIPSTRQGSAASMKRSAVVFSVLVKLSSFIEER